MPDNNETTPTIAEQAKNGFKNVQQRVSDSPVASRIVEVNKNGALTAAKNQAGHAIINYVDKGIKPMFPESMGTAAAMTRFGILQMLVMLLEIAEQQGLGDKTSVSVAVLGDVRPIDILNYLVEAGILASYDAGLASVDFTAFIKEIVPDMDVLKNIVADIKGTQPAA